MTFRIQTEGDRLPGEVDVAQIKERTKKTGSKTIILRSPSNAKSGQKGRCGSDSLHHNKKTIHRIQKAKALAKPPLQTPFEKYPLKAWAATTPGLNPKCPQITKTLPVAIVLDCNYVKAFGSVQNARDNALNEFAIVDQVYRNAFNIGITITQVTVLEECGPGSTGATFNVPCEQWPGPEPTLNSFSKWRDSQPQDAGIYHLLTSCNYTNVVGLGWINQACRTKSFTDSSGDIVSGTSLSVLNDNHYTVIAHELAHNLGAIHDCDDYLCSPRCRDPIACQCCPCGACSCKDQFVMDGQSGSSSTRIFSDCSIEDICSRIPFFDNCISHQNGNAVKAAALKAVCGNGIREGDEECDCGDDENCKKTTCCDSNCKLTKGSECYDGNDPCCQNCKIVSAKEKKLCRAAEGECKEAAYCQGEATCPPNPRKADGVSCGAQGEDKQCASGVCTSRHHQCQVFGNHFESDCCCPSTEHSCKMICNAKDQCIDLNNHYVDGTPCGEAGVCMNGMCVSKKSSSAPNTITWWTVGLKASMAALGLVAALL